MGEPVGAKKPDDPRRLADPSIVEEPRQRLLDVARFVVKPLTGERIGEHPYDELAGTTDDVRRQRLGASVDVASLEEAVGGVLTHGFEQAEAVTAHGYGQ